MYIVINLKIAMLGARAWHHHGSDTPTSPRAILHHTDAILYTFLHTTVPLPQTKKEGNLLHFHIIDHYLLSNISYFFLALQKCYFFGELTSNCINWHIS